MTPSSDRPPTTQTEAGDFDWMNSDNGSFDQNSKPIIYNNVEAARWARIKSRLQNAEITVK